MRIIDISQEVFGCAVYPGDPAPERVELMRMSEGAVCNLTAFRMCAHNGTHLDAPRHFLADGEAIDALAPERFVGPAFVAAREGEITAADAEAILRGAGAAEERAGAAWRGASRRLLVKGAAFVSEEAARVFAEAGLLLFGNESQTVGPEDAPMAVHRILLGAGTVLLEGVRLADAEEGLYLLCAAPLKLGGADGAPCRALLIAPEA